MRTVNITQLIDEAPLGRHHSRILFWCALMIVFDGYDLAIAGIALPAIMQDMGVGPAHAGIMVSAALIGMMVGNLLCGTLAERIGRRATIAGCVAVFSLFTAAAGFAHDPLAFSALRFVAGIGIGGVMPNVIAEMTEYAPARMRSTMVSLMFSGYSIGGMAAALTGKSLIASHGWPAVFLVAAAPVLLIPFALRALPESMAYAVRTGRLDALRATVARLNPGYTPAADDVIHLHEPPVHRKTVLGALFADGRACSTVMFWVACFACLFMVYGLSSWLTKLMAGSGYSMGSAMTFVFVMNAGAVAGAVLGGWLADRLSIRHVLIGMYLTAAASIGLLPWVDALVMRFVLVALAGATTIGTQILNTAYAGQFYPPGIRGTGIGWTLGMGRTGAIAAPVAIGSMMALGLPFHLNFLAIAVPGLVAAAAVSLIDHKRSASAPVQVPA